MGVEAKGFSAAQNKAAVQGVSGVLGSLRDNRKGLRSANGLSQEAFASECGWIAGSSLTQAHESPRSLDLKGLPILNVQHIVKVLRELCRLKGMNRHD